DESKCTGCGDCAQKCPVEVKNEFDLGLSKRKAIYKPFAQAIPNVYTIERKGTAPCQLACPAGLHVQGYVALIAQNKFKEALQLIRERNPLPAICGRVCVHPCETTCNRGKLDRAIAIAALKRFVADYEVRVGAEDVTPAPRTREGKIAIVGSGPAGLTAAWDLVKLGYGATIFEALPVAGGMLAVGIPDYRLPQKVLQTEIQVIQKLGVEIRLNSPVGKGGLALDDLWKQGYKAIFIAVGCANSARLNVPGEDRDGVYPALSFLKDVNLGKTVKVGAKVVVVGGGNVAIDSARTALRLGAKEVAIVYRRSKREMPADEEEIEAAEEEGVKIHYLAAPVRVLPFAKDGRVGGVECLRMELGEPDASGRKRPVPLKGSEFVVEADTVIPAIGQTADLALSSAQGKFQVSRLGTLEVDPTTLSTSIPGVFAGGDVVSGPATVIDAIAAGRRAAISIHNYLSEENLPFEENILPQVSFEDVDLRGREPKDRVAMPARLVAERAGNFREVNLGYGDASAIEEAKRCLDCGICSWCRECEKACGARAIDYDQKEELVDIDVGAVVLAAGYDIFDPELKKELGYGRYPNVVSSLQFERMLSASGPYMGTVLRPSDRKTPRRIAFIQCVGSREIDHNYCSSVCCMYATKEAIIVKEHAPETQCTIFYIDLRAFGKGYESYYSRAKELGVRYIRCRPSSVKEVPGTKDLALRFEKEDGSLTTDEFDMVVLSAGMRPTPGTKKLAETFAVELDDKGFVRTLELSPV
ncbi:MAG: FAD-dependent oxidoreductase, partial [Chloroflexota bacterium]|nr:FAD-dependent oxidoreductase [Chloroflexota bacterium]